MFQDVLCSRNLGVPPALYLGPRGGEPSPALQRRVPSFSLSSAPEASISTGQYLPTVVYDKMIIKYVSHDACTPVQTWSRKCWETADPNLIISYFVNSIAIILEPKEPEEVTLISRPLFRAPDVDFWLPELGLLLILQIFTWEGLLLNHFIHLQRGGTKEQRRTKELLDEGERREWKSWLKTQHSKKP